MKCPYDETINCHRINILHHMTGKLPCTKCRTGILAIYFGVKK